MRIPDKILSLPAVEAGRQLALEALSGLRVVLDDQPADLLRALTAVRAQLEIHSEQIDPLLRKNQRRLIKRAWGAAREFVQLKRAFEFGLSLESRRGFPDLHPLLRNEMRRRSRRLRKRLENEIRPAIRHALHDLVDVLETETVNDGGGRGGKRRRGGDVMADWLASATREVADELAGAGKGRSCDRLLIRIERLEAVLRPWSAHFVGALPLLDGLGIAHHRLARRREIEILGGIARESLGEELADSLAALESEVAPAGLAEDFGSLAAELGAAFKKGALTRLERERLFVLREIPVFRGEPVMAEIYQGWLPGARVEETISRVYDGGAPRHARRVGLGRGAKRVEVEEQTSEEVFESLWALTRGCRVRKRRYSIREEKRRVEIEEYHDRDLVLARIVGRASAVAKAPPPWLEGEILREVTEEGAFHGRRLGI